MIHGTPNSDDGTDEPVIHAAGAEPAADGNTGEDDVPVEPAPEPVHRWLDGEPVDPGDLDAPDAERHVKFWAKMKAETDRRRRLETPRGLDAIIMQKLDPPAEKGD